jgi:amylosucrase
VHDLLQAYRAVVRIAAPAVAFKAEAIVAPRDLVAYLGVGRHEGMECDLAYHNVLMVLLWSTLASRRVALLARTLASMPPVPAGAGWLTYVRCHDDIGWAITDEDAGAVGEDAHLHRRFLTEFYSGAFPGSFARGAPFQPEPDGEARISGTAASLAGLELALEQGDALDAELALRRLLLVYAVAFAFGGLPLVYMGDELALRNDPGWAQDPAHADDTRWMHRPPMDWEAAARRADEHTTEGFMWAGLRRLVQARRGRPALHGYGVSRPVETGDPHVLGLLREHAGRRMLLLASFSEQRRPIALPVLTGHGVHAGARAGEPDGRPLRIDGETLVLEPFQHAWCDG